MKKIILTLSIATLSLTAMAQTTIATNPLAKVELNNGKITAQQPFKVPLYQSDLQNQVNTYQWLLKTLHTSKMDALVRDTADTKLSQLYQLIQVRYREAFIADSTAKSKKEVKK